MKDYEISDKEWVAMENLRITEQRQHQHYYKEHKSMAHGPTLRNDKYEWIASGGGRKRYWSDDYGDHIDRDPAQQSAIKGRRLSNGMYEWINIKGKKYYWSDKSGDYVDRTPAEQEQKSTRGRSFWR